MKNIKTIKFELTYQDITFCYGVKAYSKAMKNITGSSDSIKRGTGICVKLEKGNDTQYVVSVCKPTKTRDITSVKALWVHELSHLTTYIMEDANIKDDEFRSRMIQYLYEIVIPWIDSKQ